MSNVFNLSVPEGNVYEQGECFGVKNLYSGAVIGDVDGVYFLTSPNNFPLEFKSRRDLAEFLWMAARFVDSEGKWEKSEYVGKNY